MKVIKTTTLFIIITTFLSCGTAKKVINNYEYEVVQKSKIFIEVDSVHFYVDSILIGKLAKINARKIKSNIELGFTSVGYKISDSIANTYKVKISNIEINKIKVQRELYFNNKKSSFWLDTLFLNLDFVLYDSIGNQKTMNRITYGIIENYEIKEKPFGILTTIFVNDEWDKGNLNEKLMIKHLGFSQASINKWSYTIGSNIQKHVSYSLKNEYIKKNKISWFNGMFLQMD